MKLLYILLVLTITINCCYSIIVRNNNVKEINVKSNSINSYTMVPHSDNNCKDVDSGIGFTFPNQITNSPMMLLDEEGGTNCGVITTASNNQGIKIEWYYNEFNCTNLPSKPDTIEVYKFGECKYSNTLEEYYVLTDTSNVIFAENSLKVQPTLQDDESKCGTVQDGYFMYFLNSTQFQYTRSFVTYDNLYYCDQDLQPYGVFCTDFGCSTDSLTSDCSGPFEFIYTCFGSSSSSSSN